MMASIHEPTPEFERYLEWQVTTALRRQDRFARPARTGYGKYLGAAAVVLVSMMIGAAGVAAAGRLQENQQKQLLVQQQHSELQLAQMRVAIAEKAAKDAKDRAAAGITDKNEAAAAERELQKAVLAMQRVQLNMEEVQQSGQPVQDEVTSPLVDGTDFVAQRLHLEQQGAAMEAAAAQEHLRDVKQRNEVGLATDLDLLDAQTDVVRAVGEMQTIQQKESLRQQFVAGRLTAKQANDQRMLIAAHNQLQAAESALQAAQKRYTLVEKQYKVGVVTEVDFLKAQLDMLSKKQDVDTLRARIASLEKGGGGAETDAGASQGGGK